MTSPIVRALGIVFFSWSPPDSTPKDKDFDELVSTLKGEFEPKPLIIAERFNFHRRQQAKGESVAEYISELRKLTLHCEFGSYLNEALTDRFVCGLRSEATQKKLLAEAELTLQKAVKIAQSMEMAGAKARQLQSPNSATESSLEVGKLFGVSLITGLLITGLDWTGLDWNPKICFYALWYAICHE